MIIEVNNTIMKDHNITIEQVTARQHSAHGLVERRMAFFNEQIGLFDVSRTGMTKIQASSYMRSIAARLNDKPYGLRFIDKMAQDLQMEVICTNYWKMSHRSSTPDAAFIRLPGTLQEQQSAVSSNLQMLADFFDTNLLPNLLLDIDTKRTVTDTQLEIDSIVLFWRQGNDGVRPKGSQPKLARVIDLQTDSDGKQRKAKISYTNAS